MNITKVAKSSDKKLDEEFPSLSSLPKKNPPASISVQRAHSQQQASPPQQQQPSPPQQAAPTPSPPPPNDTFPSSDARSPENLLQTELTQQDFCLALSSEMNLIPDPPFDAHEVDSANAIDTPPSYPQTKNMKLIQPEFFKKYDLSTLFFIFFYSPGTSQQYFAGRELQNRDWFFDTKFQTWVNRIEEATVKTAEYEVAKCEYFDHAANEGWCVRQRNLKLEFNNIVK